MITGWKHKGLKELLERGATRRIEQKRWDRCLEIVRALNDAKTVWDLDLPGYRLHLLAPKRPSDWSIRAWAQWRITFRFDRGNALDVDLEDYHDVL